MGLAPFPVKHTDPVVSSTQRGEGTWLVSAPGFVGAKIRLVWLPLAIAARPSTGLLRCSKKVNGNTAKWRPLKDPMGGSMQTQQLLRFWMLAILVAKATKVFGGFTGDSSLSTSKFIVAFSEVLLPVRTIAQV